MNKKLISIGYIPLPNQILRKMKLTILLVTISVICSFAIESYSQTARLTLNIENKTIKALSLLIQQRAP